MNTGKQKQRNNNKKVKQIASSENALSNPTKSIITLNVNGLNTQIKKQRLSDWVKK